jgi:hypothetical protein
MRLAHVRFGFEVDSRRAHVPRRPGTERITRSPRWRRSRVDGPPALGLVMVGRRAFLDSY